MRIEMLEGNPLDYCCNIYFVRGDYNSLDDVNTLVDVGIDDAVIGQVNPIPTRMGRSKVQQVVLTHGHYDHAGGIEAVAARFQPRVLAFAPQAVPSERVHDGQILHLGDRDFQVLITPGHSADSICLYCREEGVLFSGDTPIDIKMPDSVHPRELAESLRRLATLRLAAIYPGHRDPITEGAERMLRRTLANVLSGGTETACGSAK